MSVWFYTTRVDEMYQLVKSRQLEAALAALEGKAGGRQGINVVQEIYNPPYGGREFCIRDLNGYELFFRQDR